MLGLGETRARFQQQHIETALSQFLCHDRPAAARADYDDISHEIPTFLD